MYFRMYFRSHVSTLMFAFDVNVYINRMAGDSTFVAAHIKGAGDFLLGVSLPPSQRSASKESSDPHTRVISTGSPLAVFSLLQHLPWALIANVSVNQSSSEIVIKNKSIYLSEKERQRGTRRAG